MKGVKKLRGKWKVARLLETSHRAVAVGVAQLRIGHGRLDQASRVEVRVVLRGAAGVGESDAFDLACCRGSTPSARARRS
jgi:hypothetical protein